MEKEYSTPQKSHQFSLSLYLTTNEDGSVTTTEVQTTRSIKTRINYDADIHQSVFRCETDEKEIKIYNALLTKSEYAIFNKYSNKPVCYISINSVQNIMRLLNRTLKTGFEFITIGKYSMEEYYEWSSLIHKYKSYRPKIVYPHDIIRDLPIDIEIDNKMNIISVCNDNLDIVDLEIAKRKGKVKNKEIESFGVLREVSEEKEKGSFVKEKKKRFRMSESLKKTKSYKGKCIEEEIIEENEFFIKKRKKYINGNSIKDEIVEEQKISIFNNAINDINFNKEYKQSILTNNDDVNSCKDTTYDEKELHDISHSSNNNNNDKVDDNDDLKRNLLKIPKPPLKTSIKHKKKKHMRVLSTSIPNPNIIISEKQYCNNQPKQNKTKTHCKNNLNDKCILCKGLPVRPQQCEQCHSKFCTLCTYDLDVPSQCSECGGKIIIIKSNNKQSLTSSLTSSTTFESNLTRAVSHKDILKTHNNLNNNKNKTSSQKDFYNANKDRYLINSSWNDKHIVNPQKQSNQKLQLQEEINSYEKVLITNKNDSIWSICYCPYLLQGKSAILTGHNSGNMFAWNIEKFIKVKSYLEHLSKVYDIKTLYYKSQYLQMFASVSEDRTLKIWSSSSQHSIITISSFYPIYTIDIHPSNYLLYGDKNKNIYCQYINIQPKGEVIKDRNFRYETSHHNFIWRIKVLTNTSTLNQIYVISSSENTLQIHLLNSNENKFMLSKQYLNAHKGLIHDIMEIEGEKDTFLTCGVDHFIKLWDCNKDGAIKSIDMLYNDTIFSLMEIKGEDIVVCGSYDKVMKLINKKDLLYSKKENRNKQRSDDLLFKCEYKRNEAMYKMVYIEDKSIYKIASINYGCSSNVYFWGKVKNEK